MADFQGRPLVTQMARQPGRKEARYTHLLSGEPEADSPAEDYPVPRAGLDARVSALETELREVREQLSRIQSELGIS
jgi:uncharacterized protein YceH (UPF0502 family)